MESHNYQQIKHPFLLIFLIEGTLFFLSIAIAHLFQIELTFIISPLPFQHILGSIMFALLLQYLTYIFYRLNHDFNKIMGAYAAPLFKNFSLAQVFGVSLLAALGEEIFFRGVLQQLLGLIPASAIFGLGHWAFQKELTVYGLYTMIIGVVLGLVFIKTNYLLVPMIIHFVINFSGIILMKAGIIHEKKDC